MKGRNTALIAVIGGLALLVVVFAVFLTSGGGDDSGGSTQASGTPGSNSSSGGGDCNNLGSDLRLLGGEPLDLDPAVVRDAGSATYVLEIFSGLVKLNSNLEVVPDLAEKWDISQDGKVYTFTIRQNAKFQDDKPVTADDFKYSLDRAAKLGQTVSTTAEAYLGDIVGARDVTRGRADSISGVKVINSRTLEITIDAPKAFFLAKLTYPTAFVVEKQQVESNPNNWTRKPIGTGPYKLSLWELGERLILQANESYYAGAPSVKRVLYNLAGGSSLTQFESCEIYVSGIGIDDIERVQSDRDPLHAQYKTGPELSVAYLGFNTRTPPFDDPKVREAFATSINMDQIIRVIMKNVVTQANSFMMPGLPGYNANAKLPAFNPTRAKQLLTESKYGGASGLPKVTMAVGGGAGGATAGPVLEAFQQMWKDNLGVDVEIQQLPTADFFDDVDRGRFQMFDLGWIMDYPDPENLIDLLFYSKSRQNNTGYNNPQFDALVEQARVERDSEKRLKLYQDAEQILIRDLPWMPLYFGQTHMVVNPKVKGYEPQKIGVPFLQNVKIEP